MVDEINGKDKKINQTTRSSGLDSVRKSETLTNVSKTGKVAPTSSISARSSRGTRVMTAAEREHLLEMVSEEAEKLFGKTQLSPEQKEIIETAVKQTLDAGIIAEDQ